MSLSISTVGAVGWPQVVFRRDKQAGTAASGRDFRLAPIHIAVAGDQAGDLKLADTRSGCASRSRKGFT